MMNSLSPSLYFYMLDGLKLSNRYFLVRHVNEMLYTVILENAKGSKKLEKNNRN